MINKKFLLAGLAAFAYYKYNKMSPKEREDMVGSIKREGKKLWEQINPSRSHASSTPSMYTESPVTPNFNEGPAH